MLLDLTYDDRLRDRIGTHLAAFRRRRQDQDDLKHAAVAITLVDDGSGEAAFVLTRRAPRMNNHAGQYALPGGRLDPAETVIPAALRELREEVNLALAPTAVLGVLDDYPTRSGYLITPVVVWAGDGAELRANPAEVAGIELISLSELERPDSPVFHEIPESNRPVIRLPIGDNHLHAPSAALVYQFREVALHGRDTRVEHLEQPVWAWR